MNLHQAPLQGTLKPDIAAPHAAGTRIHGIRLLLMRVLWTILTVFNLVIFFGSIPAYYAQLFTICTDPHPAECNFGQPTPGSISALHHLGISLSSYVAYTLGVSIFASSIFLVMGLLLFWRKSDEWMAIFASIVLIIFAGVGDARAIAFQLPGGTIAFILSTLILSIGGYCGLGLFFSLFPNGRPVPRWAWTLVFLWFVQAIPWAIPPDSPYQILNWPPLVFAGEQLFMWGTAMGVQIYRYTLVSDQVQRQQSKWLIFGFALALLIDVPYSAVQGLFPALAAPDSPYLLFSATVWELFLVFIPIAIAVAILRYRLWDIDIIINRALVYGALTVSVIGLYVLVVGGLGILLQVPGNVLLSLLATGLIAILFQPLRQRLQQGVNQLMYGERDDPYRVLARLGQRLEATLTPDAVLPMIVETVAQALKLPFAAILGTPQDATATSTVLAVHGELYDQAAQERVPLIYQNEVVGDLVLLPRQRGEILTPADKRFLRDLAPQIGVAVHAVRLTAHLKQLTVDLQRSREQLVTAREEERRRLRRDLHDGLGRNYRARL